MRVGKIEAEERKKEILQLRMQNLPVLEIAERAGCTKAYVYHVFSKSDGCFSQTARPIEYPTKNELNEYRKKLSSEILTPQLFHAWTVEMGKTQPL